MTHHSIIYITSFIWNVFNFPSLTEQRKRCSSDSYLKNLEIFFSAVFQCWLRSSPIGFSAAALSLSFGWALITDPPLTASDSSLSQIWLAQAFENLIKVHNLFENRDKDISLRNSSAQEKWIVWLRADKESVYRVRREQASWRTVHLHITPRLPQGGAVGVSAQSDWLIPIVLKPISGGHDVRRR